MYVNLVKKGQFAPTNRPETGTKGYLLNTFVWNTAPAVTSRTT